ncbi:MAG: hypothetical protein OXE92_07155 [Bacteroidetes bacterium]|nr:hypothetical protein [Bacteroidota bacterium]MCY4205483.1 hypothetical protein [Bacteroidota bacterium]
MRVSIANVRDLFMGKEERQTRISFSTWMTEQEKQMVRAKAQSLGMSISAYLRETLLNRKQTTEEVLAREWVATALLLQKMISSEDDQSSNLQDVLEKVKSLIQRSLSKETKPL